MVPAVASHMLASPASKPIINFYPDMAPLVIAFITLTCCCCLYSKKGKERDSQFGLKAHVVGS